MVKFVSVIVPTLNKAEQIESALELLLNQNVANTLFEVVVVDNNSTDNTTNVLAMLSGKHSNLRYVSEIKKGPAATRNRGITESKGDLLIFLDDDMHVTDSHVRMHLEFHEKIKQPLCVVGRWRDNASYDSRVLSLYFKTHLPIIPSENKITDKGLSLASGNFSVTRNTLDLVKEEIDGKTTYFDERLLVLEDADLGLRLERAKVNFYYTKEICILHCHRYSRRQIMNRIHLAGYYQFHFDLKHPDVQRHRSIIIIKNKQLNMVLLIIGFVLFVVGYIFQPISPVLMVKGIGACLLSMASKGYQKARAEICKQTRAQ
jgi:glycosyltransferase involved in cell wall biosynthesis